jgi:hypothetical protein
VKKEHRQSPDEKVKKVHHRSPDEKVEKEIVCVGGEGLGEPYDEGPYENQHW